MRPATPQLKLVLSLATFTASITRRFDSRLGGGLGFSDFVILYQLSRAEGKKMRRIDLAETIGLTASGVTRLLAPMEKIGLIAREAYEHDARVSFVRLAPGGATLLEEAMERAEHLAEEALAGTGDEKARELAAAFRNS